MNHVGPYYIDKEGKSQQLNFMNDGESHRDVNDNLSYNMDDFFRSALSYFEGNDTSAWKSLPGTIGTMINSSDPTHDDIFHMINVPFNDKHMQEEVEADFKRLYGKDLTVENLKYAYHNTTIIGKGFLGEGDKVARPVFKFNGEFEEKNMHLLAFTLCQAVECKGMGKTLGSGKNGGFFEEEQNKIQTFNPASDSESFVYFKAPGMDLVSFNPDGAQKAEEPVKPKRPKVPRPKWYQRVAAAVLPFTSAGKRAKDTINNYNNAEREYNEAMSKYNSNKKKWDKWKESGSKDAETVYEKYKEMIDKYYEDRKEKNQKIASDFNKDRKEVNMNQIGNKKESENVADKKVDKEKVKTKGTNLNKEKKEVKKEDVKKEEEELEFNN